jgi:hypothetical protein
MRSNATSAGVLTWLLDVGLRNPGSRPIPVLDGSKWKTACAAVLLQGDAIVFLSKDAVTGDRLSHQEIAVAEILEDIDRYVITLKLKDAASQASLTVQEVQWFMMIFAALGNAQVPCNFEFTQERLRALGAD